jgi:flagellar basal body-associated protein FliL
VGLEVERPELLQKVASQMPESVRKALRELLADKDFQDFYPGAYHITV